MQRVSERTTAAVATADNGDARSSDPASDEWMRRVGDGEIACFEPLYEALARRLIPFLRGRTGDPRRAEELFHDTVGKLWELRGQFVPGSSVTAWAWAIAANKARDHARRQRRHDRTFQRGETPDRADPEATTGFERIASSERRKNLAEAITRLPTEQEQAVDLFYLQGLTYAEVGELMDKTVGGVKSTLHRARERLAGLLDPED